MSNSPSQNPKQDAPEPAAAKVVAKAGPATTKAVGVKAKTATKQAAPAVPAKATAAKPVAKLATPVASKAPAKSTSKAKPSAKAAVSPAASVKSQAAAKVAKTPAPAKAKVAKPVAKVLMPAASKTPAKAKPVSEVRESKEKKHAGKKPKLVRDSFTFPEADYAQIGVLKQRALKAGHEVKKSELLRAGLTALSALSDAALLKALGGVDKLKPGRPAK